MYIYIQKKNNTSCIIFTHTQNLVNKKTLEVTTTAVDKNKEKLDLGLDYVTYVKSILDSQAVIR